MKLRLTPYLVLAIILLASCESQTNTGSKEISSDTIPQKRDTGMNAFCDAWKKFPNSFQNKDFPIRFDVPLHVSIVDSCIEEYKRKLVTTRPNVENVKFSDYVAFDTEILQVWLRDSAFPYSNQLRIEFGIYTQKAIDMSKDIYPDVDDPRRIPDSHLNKTTVFLSPYKTASRAKDDKGNILQPFNLGSLHP